MRAAGRRGRRASRSTAGGWAPRVRGERPDHAPPSEASNLEPVPAKPALEIPLTLREVFSDHLPADIARTAGLIAKPEVHEVRDEYLDSHTAEDYAVCASSRVTPRSASSLGGRRLQEIRQLRQGLPDTRPVP